MVAIELTTDKGWYWASTDTQRLTQSGRSQTLPCRRICHGLYSPAREVCVIFTLCKELLACSQCYFFCRRRRRRYRRPCSADFNFPRLIVLAAIQSIGSVPALYPLRRLFAIYTDVILSRICRCLWPKELGRAIQTCRSCVSIQDKFLI